PTLGGYITDSWSWRWVFYVNVPVGVLAILVVMIGLPYVRSKSNWREIDFLGAATMAAGLIPLLIGLSMTSDHDWTSPQVLPPIVGGLVMLGVFFLIEVRWAGQPIIPFELFKINQFATSVIITCFSGIGMFGVIFFVPLLYQGVLWVSATNSGNLLIPMMLMLILFSAVSGQLILRIARYRFLALLGALAIAGGLWGLSSIGPDSSQWSATASIMVIGAGLGITFPLTLSVVQSALPKRFLGVATSQIQFWRTFGGTLGTAILGSILSHEMTTTVGQRIAALHLPPQFKLPQLSSGSAQEAFDPGRLAQLKASFPPAAAPLFDQLVHALRLGLADALHPAFLVGMAAALIAFLASLFLREVPLRAKAKVSDTARRLALIGA
ncbi:MAG: MFS transporter, partial [Candidatus Dormibacteraceae bacterium]